MISAHYTSLKRTCNKKKKPIIIIWQHHERKGLARLSWEEVFTLLGYLIGKVLQDFKNGNIPKMYTINEKIIQFSFKGFWINCSLGYLMIWSFTSTETTSLEVALLIRYVFLCRDKRLRLLLHFFDKCAQIWSAVVSVLHACCLKVQLY